MREISHVRAAPCAGGADRFDQSDERDSSHEIFCADAERNRKQHNFPIAVEETKRHQNAQHSTGRAHSRSLGRHASDARVGDRNRGQRSSDHAEEIEFEKSFVSPIGFQLRTEHPQSKHIEQNVQHSVVQEGICDDLEYPTMRNSSRYQRQPKEQRSTQLGGCGLQQFQEQINRGIDQDQPLHGLGEGWETQRGGSPAIHKTVASSSRPVVREDLKTKPQLAASYFSRFRPPLWQRCHRDSPPLDSSAAYLPERRSSATAG